MLDCLYFAYFLGDYATVTYYRSLNTKRLWKPIQHLYDIYRSAVQIQEILTRIDDAKNFEKVAAEMLPDYDIDELITTLQNTDIDIAHIQKYKVL